MSPFSNITNVSLLGAAAAKNLTKPEKPGDVKAKGPGVFAGPTIADGLAHSGGIRSAQASLVMKLKRVNQAINVVQSLEGESSALNDMLDKIESMIKQGSKNLVTGEKSTAKTALNELVKDMMKGLNAPVYERPEEFNETEQVLAYIGKGFSVDILEGGIVFDINKMLEDVYKAEARQERQAKKAKEYRSAMGLVKGALESLMESLNCDINKAGGLGDSLKDAKEASNLSGNMLASIREESSMLSRSYGVMDAETVMKRLSS